MVSPQRILITIEKKLNDEIDFNGQKIYFDPSFNPEWNAFPYGTVVSPPARNPLISDTFVHNVQKGDKLYFNYNVTFDKDNLIEHDGEEYWLVDYYNALAIVREGKIIPVGDHIIVEKQEEEVTHSFLIIPEIANKKVVNTGKVAASNDPSIPEGSEVTFDEIGMFENEIEGKKYFVMYNHNIMYINGQ